MHGIIIVSVKSLWFYYWLMVWLLLYDVSRSSAVFCFKRDWKMGCFWVCGKGFKVVKKKKRNAKVKSWDYCYLVHHGHNCLCLCIYLQEVILNTPLVKLLNDHQEAFAGVYCWDLQEMDPGRYGLQQGWDNNSVIVVSSLIITYVGW